MKRNRSSLLIGGAGLAALLDKLGSVLRHVQVKDLETGYEAYLLVPLPALSVKQICCGIEESHPLGRLMDIDVLALGKQGVQMIPREALGLEPRKCLLCGNEVRYCMRAKTHTTAELLERIEQILKEYELQAPNPRTD